MWKSSWYHRLRFEIFALIFLFLAFTLGIIGTTYILLTQQTQIAKTLDTASRQSLVITELEIAILEYADLTQTPEKAVITRKKIEQTAKLYKTNMQSIAIAMVSQSFGDKLQTKDGTLMDTCNKVKALWDKISSYQQTYLEMVDAADPDSPADVAEIADETRMIYKDLEILKGYTKESSSSLRSYFQEKADIIKDIQFYIFGLAIVTLLIVLYLAEKLVLSPMRTIIKMLREIATGEGNLRQRLTVVGKSEVGEMAFWFNHFVEKLCKMMVSNKDQIECLGKSTKNLDFQSIEMENSSEQILSELETIASASEEMSINIKQVSNTADTAADSVTSVSSAIEELSTNFQTVVAATEEASANMAGIDKNIDHINTEIQSVNLSMDQISDSLQDISGNTKKAMDLTGKVTASSQLSVDFMSSLGNTAQNIDKVVNLIDSIASQTNMLALNATIEAASAGESGKGFAVVAEEVKILAQETATANRDIADRIEEIQELTSESVRHSKRAHEELAQVSNINTVISNTVAEKTRDAQEINSRVNSIAQSSEESSLNLKEAVAGLQEITRNIAQASQATNESTKNLAETSAGVQDIARATEEAVLGANNVSSSLGTVKEKLSNFDSGIEENRKSTETLVRLTGELTETVEQFKT